MTDETMLNTLVGAVTILATRFAVHASTEADDASVRDAYAAVHARLRALQRVADCAKIVTSPEASLKEHWAAMRDLKQALADLESPKTDLESPKTDLESPKTDLESPKTDLESPKTDLESQKAADPERS